MKKKYGKKKDKKTNEHSEKKTKKQKKTKKKHITWEKLRYFLRIF
jgi:hypothetical protein